MIQRRKGYIMHVEIKALCMHDNNINRPKITAPDAYFDNKNLFSYAQGQNILKKPTFTQS